MPDKVRIRGNPWRYSPVVVVMMGLAVIQPQGTLPRWYFAIFAVVFVSSWWHYGITLTPTHAVVHGIWFTRRRGPWQAVTAVTLDRFLYETRVALWTNQGKVRLYAPMTIYGLGRARVESDFHTIGQWWLSHRGADWRPPPTSPDAAWVPPPTSPPPVMGNP